MAAPLPCSCSFQLASVRCTSMRIVKPLPTLSSLYNTSNTWNPKWSHIIMNESGVHLLWCSSVSTGSSCPVCLAMCSSSEVNGLCTSLGRASRCGQITYTYRLESRTHSFIAAIGSKKCSITWLLITKSTHFACNGMWSPGATMSTGITSPHRRICSLAYGAKSGCVCGSLSTLRVGRPNGLCAAPPISRPGNPSNHWCACALSLNFIML